MAKVEFDNKYKCENCGDVLGTHNGDFWNGMLLCEKCRAIANIITENGKYDYTGARTPLPSA